MAQKTNTVYGDPQAMMKQAAGLFAMHMQRNSTLNRLAGKMPAGTRVRRRLCANRRPSICRSCAVRI